MNIIQIELSVVTVQPLHKIIVGVSEYKVAKLGMYSYNQDLSIYACPVCIASVG